MRKQYFVVYDGEMMKKSLAEVAYENVYARSIEVGIRGRWDSLTEKEQDNWRFATYEVITEYENRRREMLSHEV